MKNELFIGISITIATLVVIVGILFLQQASLFGKELHLYMEVENSHGVSSGTEILYRGAHVGTVTESEITPDSVTLTLRIEKLSSIPKGSTFVIEQQSLLRGNVVQIHPGSSEESIPPGSTVQGEVKGGIAQIADKIGAQSEGLGKELEEVLENIDALLGKKTREEVVTLLEETRSAVKEFETGFEENKKILSTTLEELHGIAEENRQPLSESIEQIEKGTDGLVKAAEEVKEVSRRLDTVLRKIESGEGTMGKVIQNPALYEDLSTTMEEMNSLLSDIKENPKKYISVSIF